MLSRILLCVQFTISYVGVKAVENCPVTHKNLTYLRYGTWSRISTTAKSTPPCFKKVELGFRCGVPSHPSHGTALPQVFTPHGCALKPFDGEAFVFTMKSRTLWLFGDSLTRTFYQQLLCSLEPSGVHVISRRGFRYVAGKRFEKVRCHVYTYNVAVCFVMAKPDTLTYALKMIENRVSRNDVVLANFGLWYITRKSFSRHVQTTAGWLSRMRRKHNITTIWREVTPSFFAVNGKEDTFDLQFNPLIRESLSTRNKFSCVRPKNMIKKNWRNSVGNKIMEDSYVTILPVWDISSSEGAFKHVVQVNPEKNKVDCTHYCVIPHGVVETWVDLFLNFFVR
ncbi:hypothetical protein RI054_16g76370 [Pseudoscourfieldia marina]